MNKFVLSFVALVAAAAPAHAGPVAAVAAWVGSTIAAGGVAGFLVSTAVGAALNAIGTFIMGKQIPGGETKVQFDVQMGDDQPLRFVMGDYVTAGQRKFIGSTGPNTRDIVEVIEVSALPQGFDKFWVNDEVGEVDTSQTVIRRGNNVGWPVFNNMAEDGSPQIWMKWYDGTQAAADPYLIAAFGNDPDYPWTTEMVGRGKAYVIMTTCYNDETQTTYPSFLFKPAPLSVYDLRFDSTNGGSGSQRWNNPATWQPSTNPAVIAYNIIRGIYFGSEWVWGGKNMPAWRLPQAEWIAAANECDAPITLADGSTQPAYRCGLEVLVSQVPADVLEEIGRASNMRFAEVGGAIKPIVGIAGTSALSFTDESVLITEGQSFKPFYPISETYNALSATYPEPGENWTNKDAKEYINAEATEDDGGRYLPTSISYPAAPYGKQVQRLMRSQMRDFRRMRRHQFHLPPEAYALEPGIDTVSWTSQRNGYVNKRFLVEIVSKTPGMNVLVSLREVDPADYDWSSDFEAPITIVPPRRQPVFIQPISGLTVTPATLTDESGNTRAPAIRVSCDGDETGVTNIQIQARVLGETVPVIDSLRNFGEPFAWYLRNVLPAVTYEVRARLISDLTPKSAWSLWYSVTTPDIRLGPQDVDVETIKDEVRADLEENNNWIEGDDPILVDLRNDVDSARTEADEARQEVDNARTELGADIAAAEQLAIDNLNIAQNYTDTSIQSESVSRISGDEALAAQIRTLTAVLNSENYLENARFSDGLNGWSVSATTGTVTVISQDDASPNPIVSNAPTSNFVSIVGSSSGGRSIRQDFPVEWNENEVFQWRVYAAATISRTVQATVTWYDASGTQIGAPASTVLSLTANVWRIQSGQHTPPTGTAMVRFSLVVPSLAAASTVYFADVSFTKVDQSVIARITDLEVVVANNESALAAYKTTVSAQFDDTEALITSEASARSNADGALSGRIDTVSAKFGTSVEITNPAFAYGLDGWSGSSGPITFVSGSIYTAGKGIRSTGQAIIRGDAKIPVLPEKVWRISARARRASSPSWSVFYAGLQCFDSNDQALGYVYPAAEGVELGSTTLAEYAGDVSASQLPAGTAYFKLRAILNYQQDNNTSELDFFDVEDVTVTRAAVSTEAIARANADSALSSRVDTVTASAAGNKADITSEAIARANADSALSTRVDTVSARSNTNAADISSEAIARANADSALSSRVDTVSARSLTNAADITTERTTRTNAISALSDQVTTVESKTNRGTATGKFRVTAASNPSGVISRIGLSAAVDADGDSNSAAMFLDARSNGITQAVFDVDRFAIATGNGPEANRSVPFLVDGGIVYMDMAVIKDASIKGAKIGELEVDRLRIAGSAVSTMERSFITGATGNIDNSGYVSVLQLSYSVARAGPQIVYYKFDKESGLASSYEMRVLRTYNGNTTIVAGSTTPFFSSFFIDTSNISGPVTYGFEMISRTNGAIFRVNNRFAGVLNIAK